MLTNLKLTPLSRLRFGLRGQKKNKSAAAAATTSPSSRPMPGPQPKFASLLARPERSCSPQIAKESPVTDTVLARVAAVKTTPTLTLKGQWRELFGKEPPVG